MAVAAAAAATAATTPHPATTTTPRIITVERTNTARPGSFYYSNGGSGFDSKNTVEHITIASPQAGATYKVAVRGDSVTHGPQPYAIVINGSLAGTVTKTCKYY